AKAALAQVVLLPKEKDTGAAAFAARKHLVGRLAEDFGIKPEDVQLTPLEGRKGGKQEGEAPVGKADGHVSKNRLQLAGGSVAGFVAVAAGPLGDKVVAVYGACDWPRRDFWEQEFNALLEKFEPSGK